MQYLRDTYGRRVCTDNEYIANYIGNADSQMFDIAAYAYVLKTNVRIFFGNNHVDLYTLYDEDDEEMQEDIFRSRWVSVYVDMKPTSRNMWRVTSRSPRDPQQLIIGGGQLRIQRVTRSDPNHSRTLQFEYVQVLRQGESEIESTELGMGDKETDIMFKKFIGHIRGEGLEYVPIHEVDYIKPNHSGELLVHSPSSPHNCVYHTMYYAATGQKLHSADLEKEKEKVHTLFRTSDHPVIQEMRTHTSEGSQLSKNPNPPSRTSATYATICAYAVVLNMNIRIYKGEHSFDHHIHDNAIHKTFWIHKNHGQTKWHLSMLDDLNVNDGRSAMVRECRKSCTEWSADFPGSSVRHHAILKPSLPLLRPEPTSPGTCPDWSNIQTLRIGMQGANKSPSARGGRETGNTCHESQAQGETRGAITRETNQARKTANQQDLVYTPVRHEVDESAHDTGGFGMGRVVFECTNNIRNMAKQEALTSSMSRADRDMYALNLHEEDTLRVFDNISCYGEEDTPDISDEETTKSSTAVYMSRVETVPTGKFTALWDSGATNTVIGRGPQAQRILDGYTVIHDDEDEGYVNPMHMNDKDITLKTRAKKRIIVATGDAVIGETVETLDLGMKARTLVNGVWSEADTTVFIQAREANVSKHIPTTVFSEGHFMRENPDWTLITKGKEKYLVYAQVEIKYHPIGGSPPMRIDLRDSKGGHYMDIISAVTHVKHVTGRDNIAMNYKEPTAQSLTTKDTHVRTVSTEEITVHSVGTDTDDMVSYVQEATVKQKHANANSKTDRKLRNVECKCAEQGCVRGKEDVYENIINAQRTTEDPESTPKQRLEAIQRLKTCVAELQRYTNFMEHHKTEAIQLMAMETRRTRSASQTQDVISKEAVQSEERTPEDQKQGLNDEDTEDAPSQVKNSKEPEMATDQGEAIYEEYDRHNKASENEQKRVRFQDHIENEKIFERAAAEFYVRQEEERIKEKKLRAKDEVKNKNELAVAEAIRRKAVQGEKEKELMSDMTRFNDYMEETKEGGVSVRRDDKYAKGSTIDKVSDFDMATFLMENNVTL
jgi:hypothetical protein